MANPEKPVYFIGISWRDKGAVSDHFGALAQTLADRGNRVVLIVDQQRTDLVNHESNPAIYTYPSKVPTRLEDLSFLITLIRKFHPVCMVGVFRAVNLIALAGWLAKVPQRVVWYQTTSKQSVYDNNGPSRFQRVYQVERKKIFYRMATRIITSTQAMKHDLIDIYRISERKVVVFPNAIPSPGNELLSLPKIANRLVCVGRLAKIKGQETLIRAAAILIDEFPDLCVDFYGSGTPTELQAIARELVVDTVCHFNGKIPHKAVLENMAASSLTIVPSKDEAFGFVNIESMAVATPLVASKVGGIPEVVRDGVDGFLVPPDDPDALASRIRQLLLDQELRKKMGQNAREKFLMDYDQRNIIAQQVSFLEKLI